MQANLGLEERLGIAVMVRCFGADEIAAFLTASNCKTQRTCALSAEISIYYVIAMALLIHVHIKEVLRCLFDEFKTHLRGSRLTLRSKTSELVREEFYGLLLALLL